MKKIPHFSIKSTVITVLIIAIIISIVSITVKNQNEKNKNAVVFVLDEFYYKNVYLRQQKQIKRIMKKHYARPIVVEYSLYRFSYQELENKIRDAVTAYCPTHIVFSPITALNLYKNNITSEIGVHQRGRARLISLSKINRTDLFDVAYPTADDDFKELFASLINSQTDNVVFIFQENSDVMKDANNIQAFRNKILKDVLYINEGMREEGEIEAEELYNSLETENIKIIATLGFKNIQLLSEIIEKKRSDIIFIIPETLMDSILGKQIGAIIGLDLASLLDVALSEVYITDKTTLQDKTSPLKVEIRNKRIKNTMQSEDL